MRHFFAPALLGLLAWHTYAQQVADAGFPVTVARPAYGTNGPRVLFDEAHNNFHTTGGRFKPFADLIRNDGYSVTPNGEPFRAESLRGYDILVIANALGDGGSLLSVSQPAFTDEECAAVEAWVRDGGSLFLIADHAPIGAASAALARRFGVEMANSYTSDAKRALFATDPSLIVYTPGKGLVADHPIVQGVERVIAFTGQSLSISRRATAILALSAAAVDVTLPRTESLEEIDAIRLAARRGSAVAGGKRQSAAGRAQLVALPFGKGRVVIAAEAAMFSAQIVQGEGARELFGTDTFAMGMNQPGCDNKQLALNVMHWLSRWIHG
jgi:hypothetical protein